MEKGQICCGEPEVQKDIVVMALYLPGDDQDGVWLLAQTQGRQLMDRLEMTQARQH